MRPDGYLQIQIPCRSSASPFHSFSGDPEFFPGRDPRRDLLVDLFNLSVFRNGYSLLSSKGSLLQCEGKLVDRVLAFLGGPASALVSPGEDISEIEPAPACGSGLPPAPSAEEAGEDVLEVEPPEISSWLNR
jgi:hypothetical protein